jgi:hypothetical protein
VSLISPNPVILDPGEVIFDIEYKEDPQKKIIVPDLQDLKV